MTREVVWHHGLVSPAARREMLGWGGATIWLTGLSGSGKSTIATHVEEMFVADGRPAYILDGDNLRIGLNADLGFSDDDRRENVRRVGEVARLMADAGVVVLVPVISPFRDARDGVRSMHAAALRRSLAGSSSSLGCASSSGRVPLRGVNPEARLP